MHIGLDIDSTLHDYWVLVSAAAQRRFGIDLPYEEQFDWGITRLREDQLAVVIAETHCDAAILGGTPYPDAVETVRDWSAQGHTIHVASHRASGCHAATDQWLQVIGVPFETLHCCTDKVARFAELGVQLVVDDSPTNLMRAIEEGMVAATIEHPWNIEVCETEDVISAPDWAMLRERLAPVIAARTAV